MSELTSSSRSILYSAHLLWETHDKILVAAGTAFGEIVLWSWIRQPHCRSFSRVHSVFLGHEGSIFGVRISSNVALKSRKKPQRLLSSCSDDRTIRVWDISSITDNDRAAPTLDETHDANRKQHTGFSNALVDTTSTSSDCLAIGWGHLSRVWSVDFLDPTYSPEGVFLLSSGEDATSRMWEIIPRDETLRTAAAAPAFSLKLIDTAAYNNGKNIWSSTISKFFLNHQRLISGAADGKIIVCSPYFLPQSNNRIMKPSIQEYSVQDIESMALDFADGATTLQTNPTDNPAFKSEFFRSYTFLDSKSFLLTTNSGKIYLETIGLDPQCFQNNTITESVLVDQMDDLKGYSVCTAEASIGIAFVAGSRGSIYVYQKATSVLSKLYSIRSKVGSMFVAKTFTETGAASLVLLITLMRGREARLLYIDLDQSEPTVSAEMDIVLSELLTGLAVTSIAYVPTTWEGGYILAGFRRGSIATYKILRGDTDSKDERKRKAYAISTIERVHGKETVTAIQWVPSRFFSMNGYIISVGRDGYSAVHYLDLSTNCTTLVHNLSLPVGPSIEGLYFHKNQIVVYGFSSTKFILYNSTSEEEVMSVETGGAHRTWAFEYFSSHEGGGTVVWTRASTMRILSQVGPNHHVIRPGGHGREIKAMAVSTTKVNEQSRHLIATGAEDTDIKVFEYVGGDVVYRRTLRKHTTGIQHLQWSDSGQYLFSSGGCEEFYIWRVRQLPSPLGIGVVCESIFTPESEHSDLRIMSFDVRKRQNVEFGFIFTMAFSDSHVGIYSYDATATVKWQTLAIGNYFTSCLTQSVFLSSSTILTAGTDGHSAIWSLPSDLDRPHASAPLLASTLTWKYPVRIHQNSSKTLASHPLDQETVLIVSGGDDSSLALLLASTSSSESAYAHPPTIIVRAHASAITACAILLFRSRVFILTSGNDQWIRLWEIIVHNTSTLGEGQDLLEIKRVKRMKTNVADVSSMAILEQGDKRTKVVICGVGMEVVRIAWD
ncbi:WD40 repeat-like protein [Lojkania enalia]|uniref:WD40 repeat-like protein n=1 Tax=Lojkania enalia TaxID=147567 RepID=A0A9P4K934_9PLEO|nr:WD40 repeat-like protein [Didymosphaeria enalia]